MLDNSLSGLGLEGLGNLSALLESPKPHQNGLPLELDISLIDEDPNQPRTENNPGFSHESLSELAASISLRGIKTPISVRENHEMPGRFFINHGHRRFRASKIANKSQIPCFIDNNYISDDQVIENLHRDGLTPREIADYIGRMLAKGVKKGDIAKSLCKSAAFISQHVTLLDLPDPIAKIFNCGQIKDVTLVNELVIAYKENPEKTTKWLEAEDKELTREGVKHFRDYLESQINSGHHQKDIVNKTQSDRRNSQETQEKFPSDSGSKIEEDKGSIRKKQLPKIKEDAGKTKTVVQVSHKGRAASLILDINPSSHGRAWIKYEDNSQTEIDLTDDVILIGICADSEN